MHRPEQHQTDTAAQAIFAAVLPPRWVLKKVDPDYAIDYRLETVEGGQLTGIEAGVQLKGTRSLRRSQGCPSFAIETSHLAYYVDKYRSPVFLVLIDVTNRTGWWLFLQRYALYELSGRNWRSLRTVTLYFPETQTIEATDILETAIFDADRFMAGVRSTSIHDAIDTRRRHLESIDPRFCVNVKAEEGCVCYELHATEPVKVEFKLSEHDERKRSEMRDQLLRGIPLRLNPEEFTATGSKLIEELCKDGVTLDAAIKASCDVRLELTAPNSHVVTFDNRVSGAIEGGRHELRVAAAYERCPLEVHVAASLPESGKTSLEVEVAMNPRIWRGQAIRQLAYFETVESFLDQAVEGAAFKVEVSVLGNRLFSGRTVLGKTPEFDTMRNYLKVLRKARKVASHFSVNPTLPDDFSPSYAEGIENLYWIIGEGPVPKSISESVITIQVIREDAESVAEGGFDNAEIADLRLKYQPTTELLNCPITVGEVCILISRLQVISSENDVRRQLSHDADSVSLDLRGEPDSVWTLEKIDRPHGNPPKV